MPDHTPHILLLEPYYGGSHRSFLKGLQKHLPFDFTLISLPARKWKMRMQLAAPWMTDQVIRLIDKGNRFDAILCSTFVDVATLRASLAQVGISIPIAVYFHENQFAYPNQIHDPSIFQFTALNFTTALSADSLAFNSQYNRETFLQGLNEYLAKAADIAIVHKVDELRDKSFVLPPGIDFSGFGNVEEKRSDTIPVIVWNHRWEHDKDPDTFFKTLFRLSEEGVEFRLIVLGQHFQHCPEIFQHAKEKLAGHILHFGFVSAKNKYIHLLQQGDIVVSTALHEFFGMAVLEAVRCGCRPLVPDRLSYREIFPDEYKYKEGMLLPELRAILTKQSRLDKKNVLQLTEPYSWTNLADRYEQWLRSIK